MNKSGFDDFISMTGFRPIDIANRFNVSRQYIHQLKNNYSLTYKLALYGMCSLMIDERINELKERIDKLNNLKSEMKNNIAYSNESNADIVDELTTIDEIT